MTPLQKKILNLSDFYCQYELDEPNKCERRVQCDECREKEEILRKDFLDE